MAGVKCYPSHAIDLRHKLIARFVYTCRHCKKEYFYRDAAEASEHVYRMEIPTPNGIDNDYCCATCAQPFMASTYTSGVGQSVSPL